MYVFQFEIFLILQLSMSVYNFPSLTYTMHFKNRFCFDIDIYQFTVCALKSLLIVEHTYTFDSQKKKKKKKK